MKSTVECSLQLNTFSSNLTDAALSNQTSETQRLQGNLSHPTSPLDTRDETSRVSSVTQSDPKSLAVRPPRPEQLSRQASGNSNAGASLPALDNKVAEALAQQDAASEQPHLPNEIWEAIIKNAIPIDIHPLDALNTLLNISVINSNFYGVVANAKEIWGDSAVRRASNDSITPQQAWVTQFKTLQKETQEAIIAFKPEIDIFSVDYIYRFNAAVKPAMEVLTKAIEDRVEMVMKIQLENASLRALKVGPPEPVLSPEEIKAKCTKVVYEGAAAELRMLW